uniref:Uncharacterized protein n=1 Tax=Solanum lycopersicum TaxID=4081 RepID=K4CTA1_SOLLC
MTKNSPATLTITCNRGKGKVTLSIFVDSDLMIFSSSSQDPSDLPFGMLITHISESHFMFLEDFSLVLIKQRYNSSAFRSMGFTHFVYSWGLNSDSDDVVATPVKYKDYFSTYVSTTKLNITWENLIEMHNNLDILDITTARVPDLITKLSAMSEKVDSLKDLLLSAHFKMDSVKNVIKETCVDVASNHLKLY